jgi:hypothetical protein
VGKRSPSVMATRRLAGTPLPDEDWFIIAVSVVIFGFSGF